MSLVGTRPILPDELEQYELHHRARIAIKPGITGMWQVSGRSDITDFEEIVRLDTSLKIMDDNKKINELTCYIIYYSQDREFVEAMVWWYKKAIELPVLITKPPYS